MDITARKQGELARSRLAAIVESSGDAIIGRTLDGTITDWNKGAEAMLGYSAAEMIGRSVSVFVPPERLDELRQIHEQVQRGEVVPPFETIRIRKDLKAIDVAITVSPIRDANGNITGAAAILRDITERKRLEKEVLGISEREQSRIGQDLHDELCQHLAGIEFRLLGLKLKLEGKSKKQAAETTELARLVRQGMEQTRTLARGLSPVMLEADGLMNALQELAISTQKAFNVSCSLNCPKPVLIHDNDVATHLYRIAQEAVQNAVRHGKAMSIVINLQAEGSSALGVGRRRRLSQETVQTQRNGTARYAISRRNGRRFARGAGRA
jgi:PAS domain S-box-containing protein